MTHRISILNLLKHTILFTLFVPAIGFTLLAISIGLMAPKQSFWEVFYLFYFLPLAYYFAAIPSMLAGLAVGLMRQFCSLKSFIIRCMLALCCAALFVLFEVWHHPNEYTTSRLLLFSALPGGLSTFIYLTILKWFEKGSS